MAISANTVPKTIPTMAEVGSAVEEAETETGEVDAGLWGMLVVGDVVVVVAGFVDDVAKDVVVLEAAVLVDDKGESVDTTSPESLMTTPSCSAQHWGSLSQQKLPSLQVESRGKKPEDPWYKHKGEHSSVHG